MTVRKDPRQDYETDGHRGRCSTCRKILWPSRKAAKAAARRRHPGEHMSTYACPNGGYHYGHLAEPIVAGDATRAELYGRPVPADPRDVDELEESAE